MKPNNPFLIAGYYSPEFFCDRKRETASSALKKLPDNELVYHTDNGYIVYDRFMGEWLRRQPF